ncbi:unnamed protein product [Clonostachys rosea]|uniref:N-acetyltransferase domain-containing protein n=1 Tax=Bionectria ochroleuca TaxID=29856 RepID=A0ABY6U441_BIOOC|nr:unnamed protein product [Clonostachys rosea]
MTAKVSRTIVEFIPWDAESTEHIERLIQQRVDCGWHSRLVDGPWKEAQQAGIKCIYWIVLSESDANYSSFIQQHVSAFPQQATPLQDSCGRIGNMNRLPTGKSFVPVGHVSLDTESPGVEELNLDIPDSGVFWLKTGYVSRALQSSGIGRATMDALEVMVRSEPLYAQTLMLDTLSKDDHLREDVANAFFSGKIPEISNEEWFSSRGYKTIKTVPNFYKENDSTGRPLEAKTVFMRLDLKGSTPHL